MRESHLSENLRLDTPVNMEYSDIEFEKSEVRHVEKMQLVTDYEGFAQVNAFCINLGNIKFKEGKYPSDSHLNNFLKEYLLLDVTQIYSVLHLRHKKSMIVSFLKDEDAVIFEARVMSGVIFPGRELHSGI